MRIAMIEADLKSGRGEPLVGTPKLIVKEGVSPQNFDLSDAQLLLDGVFAGPNPSRQQYRDAVGFLSQPQILSSIITSVLADTALTQEVASRSFLHATGLERINLLATDKYQLRLHTWRPDASDKVENAHDHVYDFAAAVVYGELRKDIFERTLGDSESGILVGEFKVGTQSASADLEAAFVGERRLIPLSPENGIILPRGLEPYTMVHRTIHRLRNDPSKTVITLNLRGTSVREQSSYFQSGPYDSANAPTAPLDVTESLTNALRLISSKAGK